MSQRDGCASAQRVRNLRDRVDVGDKLRQLLARGLACELDVVGDVLRDGWVAFEITDDADADMRQPDPAGAGLAEQVV